MREGAAMVGASPTPGIGLVPLAGSARPCHACTHVHRRTDVTGDGHEVTFDAGCDECPCVASGREYSYGAHDILDYSHIDDYQPALCRHGIALIDGDDCAYSGPRALPSPERGRVAARPSVRGHALGRTGTELPGRPGHDSPDVGGVRRLGFRSGRGTGDARAADDRSQPDRVAAVLRYARGWLSRLVTR